MQIQIAAVSLSHQRELARRVKIKIMANKAQISAFLNRNYTGTKRQFIETNFGPFDGFLDRFSTDAANRKMDLMSAYEEVNSVCAYFSQERFDAQKNA